MGADVSKTEAFDRIYRSHSNLIFKIAVYYSGNYDIAQEIMQNVFLQFYVHFPNTDPDYAEAWLIRTVKNMAINYKKKSNRECTVAEIDHTASSCLQEYSAEDTLFLRERERELKALKEEIFESLYQKNPDWYTMITFTYCLGKPQTQVAKEMQISIGSLHSMMHRARKWLKRHYAERYYQLRSL